MISIFLGPPGAGKGTQAKQIAKEFSIPHISTGDIFRGEIKNETPLGKKVKSFLDNGELVPDEITIEIIKGRLVKDDCKGGFILDGFPRTVNQAKALDNLFAQDMGLKLDKVINIEVSDAELLKRLTGRRICRECGNEYHLVFKPTAKEGICDACSGPLYHRDDDTELVIKDRIEVFRKMTSPLVDYYRDAGKLTSVGGEAGIETIFLRIKEQFSN